MARPRAPKHVIYMTALNCNDHDLGYLTYSLQTWRRYCRRHGITLHLQEKPLFDPAVMPPTWQKLAVFSALDEARVAHDQVAIIDIDTMVHWDAPNFFEFTERKFCAAREDHNTYFIYRTIRDFQRFFRGVHFPWFEYFNVGVMYFNDDHRPLFEAALAFFRKNRRRLAQLKGIGADMPRETGCFLPMSWNEQTPMNFLVRQRGVEVKLLPPSFNLQNLVGKGVLHGGAFLELAHVWHFNAFDKNQRTELMKATWEVVRDRY